MSVQAQWSTRIVIAVAACGLLRPSVSRGEDVVETLRSGSPGDYQKQSLLALDFLLSIGLDRAQARAVLPTYVEACRLHATRYSDLADIQPLEIEAYREFLAQDRLNRGFTEEVERKTGRIHRRAIACRETFASDLNELAVGVWEMLSPPQQAIARRYEPKGQAVFARFADPKEQRNEARRKARAARRGPPPRRPDDPQLKNAKQELKALKEYAHPRPDIVAKYLLTPAAAQWLYELAGTYPPRDVLAAVNCQQYGTREYTLPQCKSDRKRLRDLSSEINHWNLVNGMYFSMDQMKQLAFLADKTEQFKKAQGGKRPREKLAPVAFDAHLVRLELAAESVLRPGQLQVMDEYKPCLIPPKNLKNPVRVGQANDTTHLARWLTNARGWSEERVAREIDRVIVHDVEHNGPMDEAVEKERRSLLRAVVRRAAAMSDVEFALNKDDLVEAITPEDRKQTLTASIDDMHRQRTKPGRTERFLLNRDFADVLELRYAQLAAATRPDRSEPATAPGSMPCVKSCAACHHRQ